MDAVRKEILVGEAGDEVQIVGLDSSHRRRKTGGDLREILLVPGRTMAIEWWSNNDLKKKAHSKYRARVNGKQ